MFTPPPNVSRVMCHLSFVTCHVSHVMFFFFFFFLDKVVKLIGGASALWADAFYKSKCTSVGPCVCPSICPSVCSLSRYRLNVFLPPLPEVGCPIFFEILNPWGKVMEISGLRCENFCLETV